ncbi:Uncharacterised protein r2_g3971 [Pycnogonum litorale]
MAILKSCICTTGLTDYFMMASDSTPISEDQTITRKAENAYKELKNLFVKSKQQDDFECITFELQKTLHTPLLTANVAVYKRPLWTYNFGIHRGRTNDAYVYLWDETTAKRGSGEVGSCIVDFFSNVILSSLTLSHACGGWNRNINMIAFLLHLVNKIPNIQKIDRKFMISGHSFLRMTEISV